MTRIDRIITGLCLLIMGLEFTLRAACEMQLTSDKDRKYLRLPALSAGFTGAVIGLIVLLAAIFDL